MSGTSLDGVDAVAVDFGRAPWRLAGSIYRPYPPALRQQFADIQQPGFDEFNRGGLLAGDLCREYARAVAGLLSAAGISPLQVAAIGCHGQTLRHQPGLGYTLQLMNGGLLAELSGCPVICDFRSRDVAAGGQGAPLVPAFHQAAFAHPSRHRALVNIGGIANITDLAPGRAVSGFDCGPGNVLLDGWAERHLGAPYDGGGQFARRGVVDSALLKRLLAEPFLQMPPPKSTGRETFNLDWVERSLRNGLRPQDVQATLLEVTVVAIGQALRRYCEGTEELYVCGGGAHNLRLMERLAETLPGVRLAPSDELGIAADWVEAFAFAWLAKQHLDGAAGNVPSVTGAAGPRVLGALYPA